MGEQFELNLSEDSGYAGQVDLVVAKSGVGKATEKVISKRAYRKYAQERQNDKYAKDTLEHLKVMFVLFAFVMGAVFICNLFI